MGRYDLLCIEGLARALRVFLQKEQPPTYTLSNPAQMQEVFVEASVHFPLGIMKELIPDFTITTILCFCDPTSCSTIEQPRIREFH
jgi:hypothetical protein